MSWQPPQPPPPPKPQAQESLYSLLQVDSHAHPTIIRYAYRFLAAQFHPDNAESGDAEKFRIISEAWRVLSDAGRRQAYDAQLGVTTHAPSTAAGSGYAQVPKPSLSWSEVELRLAVLQVLMEARRKRPQVGGASGKMLLDCLNCSMTDIEWTLWYLREKGYIIRTERDFMISVAGVDYIVDQLSRTEILDSGARPSGVNINLPAPLA